MQFSLKEIFQSTLRSKPYPNIVFVAAVCNAFVPIKLERIYFWVIYLFYSCFINILNSTSKLSNKYSNNVATILLICTKLPAIKACRHGFNPVLFNKLLSISLWKQSLTTLPWPCLRQLHRIHPGSKEQNAFNCIGHSASGAALSRNGSRIRCDCDGGEWWFVQNKARRGVQAQTKKQKQHTRSHIHHEHEL